MSLDRTFGLSRAEPDLAAAASLSSARTDEITSPLADRAVVRLLTTELAAVVLTQKMAIPLGGAESQIAFAFVIHYAIITWLLVSRRGEVDLLRFALLCAVSSACVLSQVMNIGGIISIPSLALMLLTSGAFVIVVPLHADSYMQLLRNVVTLSLLASIAVMIDWITQFVGWGMLDLERIIPTPFIYLEYVYIQPLQWDSPWLKPNGLVFLEASHVSQFVAMGLVVELAFFRRPLVVAFSAVAMTLSFGGTGFLIVATALPFLLARVRSFSLISATIAAVVVFAIGHALGLFDVFIDRLAEFSQSNSSAYNRFILPAERFAAMWSGDVTQLLWGTGAGTMPKAVNNLARLTFGLTWPPYTKMAVEYGIIAFSIWMVFFYTSLFRSRVPFVVCWIAFIQYQFLNGSLNVPIHTIYCWLLCAGYRVIWPSTSQFKISVDRMLAPNPRAVAGAA